MKLSTFIGNILWFIFTGLLGFLTWATIGVVFCITIICIPFGYQCFKISTLYLVPFGKDIVYGNLGVGNLLLNVLWACTVGVLLAFGHLIAGLILCLTIIGIPFGIQCFKLSILCLLPFGAQIITDLD